MFDVPLIKIPRWQIPSKGPSHFIEFPLEFSFSKQRPLPNDNQMALRRADETDAPEVPTEVASLIPDMSGPTLE